jgi:hypothetical protein
MQQRLNELPGAVSSVLTDTEGCIQQSEIIRFSLYSRELSRRVRYWMKSDFEDGRFSRHVLHEQARVRTSSYALVRCADLSANVLWERRPGDDGDWNHRSRFVVGYPSLSAQRTVAESTGQMITPHAHRSREYRDPLALCMQHGLDELPVSSQNRCARYRGCSQQAVIFRSTSYAVEQPGSRCAYLPGSDRNGT